MTVYELIQELVQYEPDSTLSFLAEFEPEEGKEEVDSDKCEVKMTSWKRVLISFSE